MDPVEVKTYEYSLIVDGAQYNFSIRANNKSDSAIKLSNALTTILNGLNKKIADETAG